MFLKESTRFKDGKEHHYWSLVENRRVDGGRKVVQRHVLLQHVIPAGAFAAGWQMPAPEVGQPELLVENIGQPAGAPLPRAAQLQLVQAEADDAVVIHCGRTLLGKEGDGASHG
jgi:hypothetical protein